MIPPLVLLARLEHELESARLSMMRPNYVSARDAVAKAQELAKQLREAL